MRELGPPAQPAPDVQGGRLRRAVEHRLGHRPRRLEELGVAHEVGEAQQRRPALARAEVFAGAAQQEVLVRDAESVAVLEDDAQPRARAVRERVLIEQDARAPGAAAPDAASRARSSGSR